MQLEIFVFSAPSTPLVLHGTVHTKDTDPISKLSIEECRETLLLAQGAGLVHDLNAGNAGLAVVPATAASQVRVVHHRQADGTTAVIWRLFHKANVKSSPADWSCTHY